MLGFGKMREEAWSAEEDTQLTRDVLETLSNLMDPEMPRDVPAETGEIKAMHNASAFLSSDGHLLEVLNSSEDNDLYVRFHAVQLVMKLLGGNRPCSARCREYLIEFLYQQREVDGG